MVDNYDLHGTLSVFLEQNCANISKIAVAVSGGADSTALVFALSQVLSGKDVEVHAITVDHSLRQDSEKEAQSVHHVLNGLSNVTHTILQWDHNNQKPETRIQEQARNARYDLMSGFMTEQGITHLFLGHHMGDQAETFLFRLAKGSGLDGLSCMLPLQEREGIVYCRPFLMQSKGALISYCVENNFPYVDDPSNENEVFARVRLRRSQHILEEEGLSAKRLAVTAHRIARARQALDAIALKSYGDSLSSNDSDRVVFNFNVLKSNEEEIVFRVVLSAINQMMPDRAYGVRLDRVERLCTDLMKPSPFRKRTLGGIIFDRNDKLGQLILSRE